MNDDRTTKSEQCWDEDLERSGGQARPLCISDPDELLAEAIDHAIGAGACRVAARLSPSCSSTWNAVAEAKRRQAKTALANYLRAIGAGHRGR